MLKLLVFSFLVPLLFSCSSLEQEGSNTTTIYIHDSRQDPINSEYISSSALSFLPRAAISSLSSTSIVSIQTAAHNYMLRHSVSMSIQEDRLDDAHEKTITVYRSYSFHIESLGYDQEIQVYRRTRLSDWEHLDTLERQTSTYTPLDQSQEYMYYFVQWESLETPYGAILKRHDAWTRNYIHVPEHISLST